MAVITMLFFYSVLGTIFDTACLGEVPTKKIKLVTVVFRHGDRTTDAASLYPMDPHINETYKPYGLGQLTSKGKRREYAIGQMLRKKYNFFLGDVYVPGEVEAISTNIDRTKASLELVLASLFAPRGNALDWNPNLNWDPIPYSYTSYDKDMWLTTSLYFCPNYADTYKKYIESPVGLRITKKNSELYEFLTDNTGLNVTSPYYAMMVFYCLITEDEWGLKLPLWSKAVYPDMLKEAVIEALQTLIATPKLKQLSGGFTLQKIINNMKEKAANTLIPENRKLYLWSAHDLNILSLSGALNQPVNDIIPYGAYYIIELVEVKGTDCVAIYTINYKTLDQVPVKIPGCEFYCPLKLFVRLLENNMPVGTDPCGNDLNHVKQYHARRNYYLGKMTSVDIVNYYISLAPE